MQAFIIKKFYIVCILLSCIFIIACDESEDANDTQPLVNTTRLQIDGSSTAVGETITWKSDDSKPQNQDQEPLILPNSEGIAVLGLGQHTLEAVTLTLIASERNGINYPRDLAFNPIRPNELWIANQSDDSAVIIQDPGLDIQKSFKVIDPAADHFMEEVSSIAFADSGRFATCQESGNTYNNRANPNLFMGPTLWSSDLNIFGKSNPDAVQYQGFDLGSHLDMLHESPYCMGITWAWDEAYWVFEGMTNSIALIDFRQDHGPGFDDHSDGVIIRYARDEVKRLEGIPSHMAFDAKQGKLWIADTGNRRIASLDTTQGGDDMIRLATKEPGTTHLEVMDGASVVTLAGTQDLLAAPSGIALYDGVIYVSDASSGLIVAFNEQGQIIDWLNTGTTGIFGITFDQDGNLYLVHGPQNMVVKISAKN